MSTIITRSGKGSALTFNEVDANFTNLNTDKLQSGNTAAALTITSATINGGSVLTSTLTDPIRHSVRPSLLLDFANTKQLDPRITFTRASTATFYDGRTTAKAEENLLVQSQTFDSAFWTKAQVVVTANSTTAPDGSSTASTLTYTASGTLARALFQPATVSASVIGTQYTKSFYAKYVSQQYVQIPFATSSTYANFDIQNGTLGSTGANVTSSITSVGNGWYRCVATYTATGTNLDNFYIWAIDSSSSTYAANSTAGGALYAWGAQHEIRSAVTAYTPTTTAAITNYIPALQTAASGVARFDHNPTTGESLGLLIEEQRVNLLTYSEDFSNGAWTGNARTVTTNTLISPDGNLTADTVTSTGSGSITQTVAASANTPYTGSVWLKVPSGSLTINLYRNDNGTGFSSQAVTVTTTWQRFTITATSSATASQIIFQIGGGSTFNSGSVLYMWGAQLEAGAFATSYIPTVASQVTRPVDAVSMTGTNFSSWYRTDEGTLYGESIGYTIENVIIGTLNDGTASNVIMLDNSSNAGRFYIRRNATVEANFTTSAITQLAKLIGTYKTNDCAATANGVTSNTDSSVLLPVVNTFSLGKNVVGNQTGNQTIKKLAYYPKRLTNQEIQSLTTI